MGTGTGTVTCRYFAAEEHDATRNFGEALGISFDLRLEGRSLVATALWASSRNPSDERSTQLQPHALRLQYWRVDCRLTTARRGAGVHAATCLTADS